MKQVQVGCILLLFFCHLSCAQEGNIPADLFHTTKITLADTAKLIVLNDRAYDLRNDSARLSYQCAMLADSLCQVIGYPRGRAYAQITLGILARKRGDLTTARQHYQRALGLRRQIKDRRGVASCYNNLGNISSDEGRLALAEREFQAGLESLEQMSSVPQGLRGKLLNNLSMVHYHRENYVSAVRSVDSSIVIREQLNDWYGLANAYMNAGTIYQKMNWWEQSRGRMQQGLALFREHGDKNGLAKSYINLGSLYQQSGQLDSARWYFEHVRPYKEYLGHYTRGLWLKNMGSLYDKLQWPDTSLNYYLNSLLYIAPSSHKLEEADVQYNIGRLYLHQDEPQKAMTHLEASRHILDSFPAPYLQSQLYFKLSENYAQLQRFDQAFSYSNRGILLLDSIDQAYREAVNYKFNYETLRQQQQLAGEKRKTERVVFSALLVLLLMCGLGFFFLAKRKREKADAQKAIDDLLKEQELKTLYARLEGQDAERVRIGEDLHDRLGVMLSTIKLYFQSVEDKLDELQGKEPRQQFDKATDLLDNACVEIRKIAHDMQSSTLLQFGLAEELKELADSLRESQKMEVVVSVFGLEQRMESSMESAIYKIIQELVANALKHAQASKIQIHLNRFEQLVNLIVEDNGIGFAPQLPAHEQGMGLKNIRSRVLNLQGSLHIDSNSTKGTSITIDIPYQQKSLIT
ncbi:MAG: sensor histidine kinase [Bacteroidota bacterium]